MDQPPVILPIPQVANPAAPIKIKRKKRLVQVLKRIGPGLITGASDDDPSAIGTYVIAGATFGYATLWTALYTFPMMIVVQYICAKIGLVSGKGLGSVLREHYPRRIVYPAVFALLMANTITAGVDMGAVAAAIGLVLPVPVPVLVILITVVILAFQIWGSYRLLSRIFKWLTLALFAYVAAAIFAHPNWTEVLHSTLIPTIRFDGHFLSILVALFGQALTPFMFFWQADSEAEEKRKDRRGLRLWRSRTATDDDLQYAAWDISLGMLVCNLVMHFIILSSGATLFAAAQTNVKSAVDAAQALRPLAGNSAALLFAIGVVGAGFLAVPVLIASGAYAVSEALGWRYGLDYKPHHARNFYLVIVAATLLGMAVNFLNINPIDALFWVSVLDGVIAGPLLIVIMRVANNKKVMGRRVNTLGTNILGWATTLVMIAAAVGMFVLSLRGA